MNTYEIQVYKNGQWEFGSYFDDRSDAVGEARRILASSRYAGVRVVHEDYDQDTNKATNSVVFSRLDKSDCDAKSSPAKAAPQHELMAEEGLHRSSGKVSRAATSGGGMARMVTSLVLVIAAGVAAMVGMQFYN